MVTSFRSTLFILPFILQTHIGFTQDVGRSVNIRRIDGSVISSDSLAARIQQLMKAARVAGLCITVLNDNQPVFSRAFGYANAPSKELFTPATVMYGASLSKVVFAYIVMQLVQEKLLDLDKPLQQYLSQPLTAYDLSSRRTFKDLEGDDRYKKITARMCLDHTTGFPNWRWIEPDKKIKIKFEPGSRYSYSGEGLYLLQFVIEKITGIDYESIAQARVFKPLHMDHSSYVWQEKFAGQLALGHDSAFQVYPFAKRTTANCAGSLNTSLEDYTRFFTTLMTGAGLSKPMFQEMIRPQIRIRSVKQFGPLAWKDSTTNDAIQLSYGLGLGLIQTPYGKGFFKEGHDDGWGHYTIAFPDQKTGIVILTNSDNGESIFKELLATAIGDRYTPWEWENYIPYK